MRDLKLEKCISAWDEVQDSIIVKTEALRQAADSYQRNILRVNALTVFPLIVTRTAWKAAQFLERAAARMNEPPPPFGYPVSEAMIQEIQREADADTAATRAIRADREVLQRLVSMEMRYGFRMVGSALTPDTMAGAEAWLSAQITGVWTAFEALAEDLWEAALNAHPHSLASLRVPKGVKDKEKSVRLDWLERFGFDLSSHMGTALKDKFEFDSLEKTREAYAVASFDGDETIAAILGDRSLDALSAVRNVLIHNGGIVDEKFIKQSSHLPAQMRFEMGQAIELDGEIVAALANPVTKLGQKLVTAIDNWLVSHPSRGGSL